MLAFCISRNSSGYAIRLSPCAVHCWRGEKPNKILIPSPSDININNTHERVVRCSNFAEWVPGRWRFRCYMVTRAPFLSLSFISFPDGQTRQLKTAGQRKGRESSLWVLVVKEIKQSIGSYRQLGESLCEKMVSFFFLQHLFTSFKNLFLARWRASMIISVTPRLLSLVKRVGLKYSTVKIVDGGATSVTFQLDASMAID